MRAWGLVIGKNDYCFGAFTVGGQSEKGNRLPGHQFPLPSVQGGRIIQFELFEFLKPIVRGQF